MMKYRWMLAAACACAMSVWAAGARGEDAAPQKVDLSGAIQVKLPRAGDAAVAFTTPDGKHGWVKRISNEELPTPAYANGRLFTGGGMSSQSFYAIDAATGKTLWSQATKDNGPTSPVVSGNDVCYNTESCDTEIRDTDDGRLSWSEVTGGSLMTQPVIAGDLLVIPHPTMTRRAVMGDDSFRMLAVELHGGKHVWDRNMSADVFGAPVYADQRVYFACTDGRLFCETFTSAPGWHIVANATSSPVVVGNLLAVTTESRVARGSMVEIRRYRTADGGAVDKEPLASTFVESAVISPTKTAAWDYQGPKIVASGESLFNAPGLTVNCVDLKSGALRWRTLLHNSGASNKLNATTPPALGKENLYIGTGKGQLVELKQSDGSLVRAYSLGVPLASEPILANGAVYAGTENGLLVCLNLGDSDANGWTAWGGDESHNKVR